MRRPEFDRWRNTVTQLGPKAMTVGVADIYYNLVGQGIQRTCLAFAHVMATMYWEDSDNHGLYEVNRTLLVSFHFFQADPLYQESAPENIRAKLLLILLTGKQGSRDLLTQSDTSRLTPDALSHIPADLERILHNIRFHTCIPGTVNAFASSNVALATIESTKRNTQDDLAAHQSLPQPDPDRIKQLQSLISDLHTKLQNATDRCLVAKHNMGEVTAVVHSSRPVPIPRPSQPLTQKQVPLCHYPELLAIEQPLIAIYSTCLYPASCAVASLAHCLAAVPAEDPSCLPSTFIAVTASAIQVPWPASDYRDSVSDLLRSAESHPEVFWSSRKKICVATDPRAQLALLEIASYVNAEHCGNPLYTLSLTKQAEETVDKVWSSLISQEEPPSNNQVDNNWQLDLHKLLTAIAGPLHRISKFDSQAKMPIYKAICKEARKFVLP
jgi:hypothetical protein